MAGNSSVSTMPTPLPPTVGAPASRYESFIDQRLSQTRRQVKAADIASALVALAVALLIYLFVATLLDHWLVRGGLGFWARLLLWLGLLGLTGAHVVCKLLPPLTAAVNPLFAAAVIEHSQPGLRNSIINFLLLRRHRTELSPPIYEAVERRAAVDLARVPADAVVDRTWLIRLSRLLAIVLAVCCLYLVLSPKSMWRSTHRVLWPWADVPPPTRVEIRDVRPGHATALQNEFLTISAEISGLKEDETPLLYFSTTDGQSVDQAIPLVVPEGEYRYQCRLPPGKLGFQQDYTYYLKAGDAQTRVFHVEVQIAPMIVVEQVDYQYPAYTGLAPSSVKNQGDLRAIEGTAVTLHAAANMEIKPGSAEIDLGCTGRRGVSMNVAGKTAVGRFTLRLHPEDASRSEFDSYQLRFADLQGRENRRPIRHRIEVIPDLPPEIQLLEPVGEELQLPVDGELAFSIRAEDPDFALRRVVLRMEHDGRSLSIPPLLEKRKPAAAWPGEFTAGYQFRPADFGLKPGVQLLYWAEAEDNKEPLPNRSLTTKRRLIIIEGSPSPQSGVKPKPQAAPPQPDARQDTAPEAQPDNRQDQAQRPDESQQPPAQNEQPAASEGRSAQGSQKPSTQEPQEQPSTEQPPQKQPSSAEAQPSGQGKESPKSGAAADGKQSGAQESKPEQAADAKQPSPTEKSAQTGGESAHRENERIDPDAAPGDAIQEILNERRERQAASSPEQKAANEEQSAEKPAGQQEKRPSAAGSGNGASSPESSPPDAQKTPAEPDRQTSSEKASGSQSAAEKPSVKESPKALAPDSASAGEEQASPSEDKASDKAASEKKGPGQQPSGSAAGGEEKQPTPEAEQQPGKPATGAPPSPSEKKPAPEEPADGPPPEPQEQFRPDAKKTVKPGRPPQQRSSEESQSPSISKKPSSAQGDTPGERSGGGGQGGGQQAPQPGKGQGGEHAPADEGAGESPERGEGEIGSQPGDQPQAGTKTPHAAEGASPSGEQGRSAQPGDSSSAQPQPAPHADGKPSSPRNGQPPPNIPSGKPQDSALPTEPEGGQLQPDAGTSEGGRSAQAEGKSSGRPLGGGPASGTTEATKSEELPPAADEANLEYARRQTELALEYLREQLALENPPLLERLGWSKEEARRFLERWEAMRRAASDKGPVGQAARKQLDEALFSLGLRPRGTELRHGGVAPDRPDKLREHGRFAPPPDWAEQFRAYTRGIAGADRGREE